MEQPLLSSEKKESERLSSYQQLEKAGAVIPAALLTGADVSADELQSAATFYPPSLHASLLSPPENFSHNEHPIGYPLGANYGHSEVAGHVDSQVLDEVAIRELLMDHVGHRCCWGSRPARTWTIHAVEDCNVYVGTLETFVEERDAIIKIGPYLGGEVDGRAKGVKRGVWELDLTSEYPMLFTPHMESQIKIPHSESVNRCLVCRGRGNLICPTCNSEQEEPGFYRENQVSLCPDCPGRGLTAHKDGLDSICKRCNGKGVIPCGTCGSRGLVRCKTCRGGGYLRTRHVAVVEWKTFLVRKVSTTSGAASVPDEVFHRAKGVQLYNTQACQCTPAFFADSFSLNKFSSDVIAERAQVPPSARVICERHVISVIPVTRVTMSHQRRSFSFYIIGTDKEVYMKDSYPSRFCWGLCPCFDWLKL